MAKFEAKSNGAKAAKPKKARKKGKGNPAAYHGAITNGSLGWRSGK
jgi:hypothetical protein